MYIIFIFIMTSYDNSSSVKLKRNKVINFLIVFCIFFVHLNELRNVIFLIVDVYK